MGPVRGEGGTRFEKRKKSSLIVGLFFRSVFFCFFCVWFRLPGWSVGLYVVVAENGSCRRRRDLVIAHGMVVRE